MKRKMPSASARKRPASADSLYYSPFSEPDAERLEAARVQTEAQLRWHVGTGQAGPSSAIQPERERPSAWHWTPARSADASGDALYEASLNTLQQQEALRAQKLGKQTKAPLRAGPC